MLTGTGKKEIAFARNLILALRADAPQVAEDSDGEPIVDMRKADAAEDAFVQFFDAFLPNFDAVAFRRTCRKV